MENNFYPRIALTGAERSGKDKVGGILVANHGFTRHALGDLIKQRITYAPTWQLVRMSTQHSKFSDLTEANALDITIGFLEIRSGSIDAFTENDAEKNIIRPALERYGEVFRDELMPLYYADLPEIAVNTRLIMPSEAKLWAENGGVTIEVIRPGKISVTPWGAHCLAALHKLGLVTAVIHNDGSLEDLAVQVAAACRMPEK